MEAVLCRESPKAVQCSLLMLLLVLGQQLLNSEHTLSIRSFFQELISTVSVLFCLATQTTSSMATLVCASSQTDVVPQPCFWQSSPIHTPRSSPNHVPVVDSDEEMSEEVTTKEVDPSYVASMCDTTTG